jgi:hypothetical protein
VNFGALLRSVLIIGLGILLCACDDDQIRAYREPKQQSRNTQAGEQPEAQVAWATPPGWESIASDQPMRVATFKTGSGMPEVSLTAFPGDTGGLLANINRWRSQLGLQSITDAQIAQNSETTTIEGVSITTVDFTGSSGQEMLGAMIVPGDGQAWFAKATGEPAAIAKLKPAFIAFAKSFRLHARAGTQNPAAAPPVAPAVGGGEIQTRLTNWKPPQNWKADPNASAIVAAAYEVTNTDGGAKVTATMLMSSGGGILSNINRWRDQLGLPAVDSLDNQKITDLGNGNLIVDLASADNARRMMAAIIAAQDQTWFFKITGSPKGVEAERRQFEGLVRSVGLGETPR